MHYEAFTTVDTVAYDWLRLGVAMARSWGRDAPGNYGRDHYTPLAVACDVRGSRACVVGALAYSQGPQG